jgi:hypothetical protein
MKAIEMIKAECERQLTGREIQREYGMSAPTVKIESMISDAAAIVLEIDRLQNVEWKKIVRLDPRTPVGWSSSDC